MQPIGVPGMLHMFESSLFMAMKSEHVRVMTLLSMLYHAYKEYKLAKTVALELTGRAAGVNNTTAGTHFALTNTAPGTS